MTKIAKQNKLILKLAAAKKSGSLSGRIAADRALREAQAALHSMILEAANAV